MNKNTIIAVGLCAVLGALGLWVTKEPKERGISRISFEQLDKDAVTGVTLAGANAATLEKNGDDWTVGGKTADGSAIGRLIETLAKAESSNLVTENQERHADYEVDDDKGIAVTLTGSAGELARVVIGKSSGGGAYLRQGDEVYLVEKVSRHSFSRTTWIKKKLFDHDVDDVTRVVLTLQGKAPYASVKGDDGYRLDGASALPEGFRFDAKSAKRLVRSLTNLSIAELVDEDPGDQATGLGTPSRLAMTVGDKTVGVLVGLWTKKRSTGISRSRARLTSTCCERAASAASTRVPTTFGPSSVAEDAGCPPVPLTCDLHVIRFFTCPSWCKSATCPGKPTVF